MQFVTSQHICHFIIGCQCQSIFLISYHFIFCIIFLVCMCMFKDIKNKYLPDQSSLTVMFLTIFVGLNLIFLLIINIYGLIVMFNYSTICSSPSLGLWSLSLIYMTLNWIHLILYLYMFLNIK